MGQELLLAVLFYIDNPHRAEWPTWTQIENPTTFRDFVGSLILTASDVSAL